LVGITEHTEMRRPSFPLTVCKAWYSNTLRILCQRFLITFEFQTIIYPLPSHFAASLAPLLRCCCLQIRFDHTHQSIVSLISRFRNLRHLEIIINDYNDDLLKKLEAKSKALMRSILNTGINKKISINLVVQRRRSQNIIIRLDQSGELMNNQQKPC
jgi:hypothetical protein